MGDQHAARTPHDSRGRTAKALVIAGICLIAVLSWGGLPTFETRLWVAYAVMALIEIVAAGVLFFSRWTNRPAAVVLAILAVFQAGQSYFYEQQRYTSADPVIPVDNFGVFVLCALAIFLISVGPSWPVRR
ncbi:MULTISPECIES: hypothetical protein [Nocardiaceae]|uniref:hypothetical protein n=1 Tax=Nocardiaceae TaxID=85025 RepID=UPI0011A09EC9|nr:hypothetical protein [Prescottella equi]